MLRAARCAPSGATRWGDYTAASLDGLTTDNIWIASEYAGICPGGDWRTAIGKVHF